MEALLVGRSGGLICFEGFVRDAWVIVRLAEGVNCVR